MESLFFAWVPSEKEDREKENLGLKDKVSRLQKMCRKGLGGDNTLLCGL